MARFNKGDIVTFQDSANESRTITGTVSRYITKQGTGRLGILVDNCYYSFLTGGYAGHLWQCYTLPGNWDIASIQRIPAAPDWTKYRRVDVVIECMDVTRETRRALIDAMPHAYGGEEPGEDSWPEPDSKRDAEYKLSRIWNKISADAQADILKAYEAEERRYQSFRKGNQI